MSSKREKKSSAAEGVFAAPNWVLLLAYAAAIFVSASLLFAVQPCSRKSCFRGSAARRRCGRSRWCFFRRCCSRATLTPICLRKYLFAAVRGRHSYHRDARRDGCAPAFDRGKLGPSARARVKRFISSAFSRFRWAAVFRARREFPAAAGVVRANRNIRPRRIRIFSMPQVTSGAFSRC